MSLANLGLLLAIVGPPVAGASLASRLFARGAFRRGCGALLGGTAVQTILGCLAMEVLGSLQLVLWALVIAAVSSAIMVALVSPVLIMAAALGRRSEHDTGDTMLARRRSFARLAIIGKVPGYRVRKQASPIELRDLRALYSVSGAHQGVLERVDVASDGGMYRGGLVGTPIALVPIKD